jgi:hypothetical protein
MSEGIASSLVCVKCDDDEYRLTGAGRAAAEADPYFRQGKKLAIALDALREVRDEPYPGFGPVRAATALDRIAALGPSLGEMLPGDEGEAADPEGEDDGERDTARRMDALDEAARLEAGQHARDMAAEDGDLDSCEPTP